MWYDLTWIRRYFHSKRQPRTIFCENNCHFVNLLSFASSSFFLSMRKMKWLNSQQPNTRGHVEHHSISESAQAHEKKEWTTMPLMYIDIPFTFHQIILQVYVHILWPFLSTIKEVGEGYVLLLCFVWIVASVFTTITTTTTIILNFSPFFSKLMKIFQDQTISSYKTRNLTIV